MMTASGNVSLRPPSSGSRSPSPAPIDAGRANASGGAGLGSARQSMGPGARPQGFAGNPLSPRPGGAGSGARPTSELLGNNLNFNTPEAEAIDQWFENLQNYEATLEEMAAASLDVNFKEELSAIEQWFKVLSEAERTAALYSLLQHSTQVQIRFFITVLQQMARADPMTALLSPAVGGSMQQQMEDRLRQLTPKSPGIKGALPQSPVARSFSGAAAARGGAGEPPQSPGFLSPEMAAAKDSDAAGVLAQKRAQLKARNDANRLSAPALAAWGVGAVGDDKPPASPTQELTVPASATRPKSTDFSGLLRSPRPGQDAHDISGALSPLAGPGGESWGSLVNTPAVAMFPTTTRAPATLDAAAQKLGDWNGAGARVPMLDDAKKFRRVSKDEGAGGPQAQNNGNLGLGNATQRAPSAGSWRGSNAGGGGSNAGGNGLGNGANWSGAGGRSPALSSTRMGGSDDGSMAGMAGMGMMPGMMGMNMNPFMLANMAGMGLTPEAQLLAVQMAAAGGFGGQPGMSPFGNLAALQAQQFAAAGRGGGMMGGGMARNARMPSGGGMGGARAPAPAAKKNDEEDVDPRVLEDVPAWLRTLRLHKYTPNFERMTWRDMVAMDEAALEANGVAALGARRKLLKTFEVVRKKMGIPEPGE